MKQKDLWYSRDVLRSASGNQPGHPGRAQCWLCPARAGTGLITSTILGLSGHASACAN